MCGGSGLGEGLACHKRTALPQGSSKVGHISWLSEEPLEQLEVRLGCQCPTPVPAGPPHLSSTQLNLPASAEVCSMMQM